ncbi:MAG: hypothetical protein V3V95_00765, partial [Thermodesulfobacteriota bacterium]
MKLFFLRALFIVFAAFIGYIVLFNAVGNSNVAYIGLVSGLLIALAAIFFEDRVKKTPLRIVLGGALGLTTGLIIANLVTYPLASFIDSTYYQAVVYLITNSLVGYHGLSVGMKKGDEFKDFNMNFIKFWGNAARDGGIDGVDADAKPQSNTILMDTSVIIDGRINDICKTGFLDGSLVVPQFVLTELQNIADSSEPIRRARGKRGLDILHKLQQDETVGLSIIPDDVPEVNG